MKERRKYKGCLIEARAIPVLGGGWTSHFSIEQHRGCDVLDTRFQTGQLFETDEAALQAGFHYGAHKVESGFASAQGSQVSEPDLTCYPCDDRGGYLKITQDGLQFKTV